MKWATTQVKAIERDFPEVLFIVVYQVVLCFESVDEILWSPSMN